MSPSQAGLLSLLPLTLRHPLALGQPLLLTNSAVSRGRCPGATFTHKARGRFLSRYADKDTGS